MIEHIKIHLKHETHLRREFPITTMSHLDFPLKSDYDRQKIINTTKPSLDKVETWT